jgi:hypothetical protein
MVLLNPGAVFGHQFNYIQFFLRLRVPLAMAAIVFAILGLGANFLGIEIAIRGAGDAAATHPITALCLIGTDLSILRLNRFG